MKIFLAMPHFARRTSEAVNGSEGGYASHIQAPHQRLPDFIAAIRSYISMFPKRNIELSHDNGLFGEFAYRSAQHDNIDICICVSGNNHLIDMISNVPDNVIVSQYNGDPMHLGFACHAKMVSAFNNSDYDYFVYAEDDIALFDRDAFKKLTWFESEFGEDFVLQPNRYEYNPSYWQKIYVDGHVPIGIYNGLVDKVGEKFSGNYHGNTIEFVRHGNPMAGSFFLTRKQMSKLVSEPSMANPSKEILSYLETAQILPIIKKFKVLRPSLRNAAFFEVQHTGARLSLLSTSQRTLEKAIS